MSRYMLVVVAVSVCVSSACWGAVSITGAVRSGRTVTISGAGFGSHDGLGAIEWTGANIEAGAPGGAFSKSQWSAHDDSAAFTMPRYSAAMSHSGSQSILCRMLDGDDGTGDGVANEYCSILHYDSGADFTSVYATWWVYFKDNVPNQGQWKIWRVQNDASVRGGNTHVMSSQWFQNDGGSYQSYWISYCPAGENLNMNWEGQFGYKGQWMRFEYYFVSGSDGHLIYNVYTTDSGVKRLADQDVSTGTDTRYLTWQNYYGNHNGPPGTQHPTDTEIYMDDIFVQTGTQARVEIGDAPTWEACVHKEIQLPTSWADGQIQVALQLGSFDETSDLYLYVVDADGNVNANGHAFDGNVNANGDALDGNVNTNGRALDEVPEPARLGRLAVVVVLALLALGAVLVLRRRARG